MSNRDERLGPYGMYSREGVERIGLKRAAENSIRHIEHLLEKGVKSKLTADDLKDEIVKLRRVAMSATT